MTATPRTARTAALRRPIRRLLRVYFVTMQVVLSYALYSLRRSLEQAGYEILEERGIPAPFYLALGKRPLADLLMGMNRFLIKLSRNLFSYQIALVARPTPTLEILLDRAKQSGQEKAKEMDLAAPGK